jgi:hypothetical protein
MGILGSIFRGIFGGSKRSGLNTRYRNGYRQYRKSDGSWEYTHRTAAAKKLGGIIFKGFVVHHKDGNKQNNRWWNLWVMPRDKHTSLHLYKRRHTK